MKKILFSALIGLAFCFSANAQIVVSNNYDSPISGDAVAEEEDDDLEFGLIGVGYYSFDGIENWGLNFARINPNGLGWEMGFRLAFEEHGNYNYEMGINYSFKLLSQDSTKAFLTLALGPSFRSSDQYNIEKNTWESKSKVDAYANARLAARFNRFYAAVGYYLWAVEFKIDGDYRGDGLNLTLGYTF